jgi:hypothetical protein
MAENQDIVEMEVEMEAEMKVLANNRESGPGFQP